MKKELPETYQPTALREVKKRRRKVMFGYGFRNGSGVQVVSSPISSGDVFVMLEYIPSVQDFDKGMPVIVRLNKDGTNEVLYVWHTYHCHWFREK